MGDVGLSASNLFEGMRSRKRGLESREVARSPLHTCSVNDRIKSHQRLVDHKWSPSATVPLLPWKFFSLTPLVRWPASHKSCEYNRIPEQIIKKWSERRAAPGRPIKRQLQHTILRAPVSTVYFIHLIFRSIKWLYSRKEEGARGAGIWFFFLEKGISSESLVGHSLYWMDDWQVTGDRGRWLIRLMALLLTLLHAAHQNTKSFVVSSPTIVSVLQFQLYLPPVFWSC